MGSIDRSKVKDLHQAIDAALKQVATSHGFEYKPGSLRYDDLSVRGRVTFILAGKKQEFQVSQSERGIGMTYLQGHLLKVGDKLILRETLNAKWKKGQWFTLVGATSRGSIRVTTNGESKVYKVSPNQIEELFNHYKATPAEIAKADKQKAQADAEDAKFAKQAGMSVAEYRREIARESAAEARAEGAMA